MAPLLIAFAPYAPLLWWAVTAAAVWTYWRTKLSSLLGMAAGSLILGATTSLLLWFGDSITQVRPGESPSEIGRRVMEINVLSMAGFLIFVAGTIALMYRIADRRARA